MAEIFMLNFQHNQIQFSRHLRPALAGEASARITFPIPTASVFKHRSPSFPPGVDVNSFCSCILWNWVHSSGSWWCTQASYFGLFQTQASSGCLLHCSASPQPGVIQRFKVVCQASPLQTQMIRFLSSPTCFSFKSSWKENFKRVISQWMIFPTLKSCQDSF